MNRGGFSWRRLLGITRLKCLFARRTGIPTTWSTVERRLGSFVISLIKGWLK